MCNNFPKEWCVNFEDNHNFVVICNGFFLLLSSFSYFFFDRKSQMKHALCLRSTYELPSDAVKHQYLWGEVGG